MPTSPASNYRSVTYTHIESGRDYLTLRLCLMKQQDGNWVEAIMYSPIHPEIGVLTNPEEGGQIYIRDLADFLVKFSLKDAVL